VEKQPLRIMMSEVIDPKELAAARVRREQLDRNYAWLQAYASAVYA
jgi:hypothetical protein